jgi:hypothetical protein
MRSHGKTRVGTEGLTNHSTHDLYGTVTPFQVAVEKMPVRIKESVRRVWEAEPPKVFRTAEGRAGVSILVGIRVRRLLRGG